MIFSDEAIEKASKVNEAEPWCGSKMDMPMPGMDELFKQKWNQKIKLMALSRYYFLFSQQEAESTVEPTILLMIVAGLN
jgi:hypothetical protein